MIPEVLTMNALKPTRIRRLICALMVAVMLATSFSTVPVLYAPTVSAASTKKIKLSETNLTLYNGEGYQLTVSGTKAAVKWSSSNKRVATVKDGFITTKSTGSSVIVAKVSGKKLKCKLTVKPLLSTNVTSLTLMEGGKKAIKITFFYSGNVKYELQNSSIATCQWGGSWDGDVTKLYVIARHPGVTNLILTNTASNDKVNIKIRVKSKEAALSPSQNDATVEEGKSMIMTVLAREYGDLSCSVADSSVVSADIRLAYSYDQFRLTLTGKSPGSTTVTVKNDSTGSKITIPVTVPGREIDSLTHIAE